MVWAGRVEKGGAPRGTQTQKKWGWGAGGGGPKGWGPEGVGARRGGGPKGWGASHHQSFSLLPCVFSWNFVGVFEAPGPSSARLEFSGCRVKRSWPTLANPTLANFSVLVFWPNFVVDGGCFVFVVVVVVVVVLLLLLLLWVWIDHAHDEKIRMMLPLPGLAKIGRQNTGMSPFPPPVVHV